MEGIIIYGSRYGHASAYARMLSALVGFPVVCCGKSVPLADAATVVYIGSLYAGGVVGLVRTFRRYTPRPGQRVFVVTVGISDPADETNVANICSSVRRQLPFWQDGKVRLFHLRGGIDYGRLSFIHKTMMWMLYRSLRKKEAGSLSQEDRLFMELYGCNVDFTDHAALAPLVCELWAGSAL